MCYSCDIDISKEDLITTNKSLTIIVKDSTFKTISETKILPYSPKYNKLNDWLKANTKGWENSPVSYMPRIYISSEKYRLLIVNNGAVISYTDKNGKVRQLAKRVKNDEFKFLLEL